MQTTLIKYGNFTMVYELYMLVFFEFRFNIKQLNYSEVAKYAVVQYTPNKPIWGKVSR